MRDETLRAIHRATSGLAGPREFERWLYAGGDALERELTSDVFLDLCWIDYTRRHWSTEVRRCVRHLEEDGTLAAFRGQAFRDQVKRTLKRAGGDDLDAIRALVECYDLYCSGASFLRPIALDVCLRVMDDWNFNTGLPSRARVSDVLQETAVARTLSRWLLTRMDDEGIAFGPGPNECGQFQQILR